MRREEVLFNKPLNKYWGGYMVCCGHCEGLWSFIKCVEGSIWIWYSTKSKKYFDWYIFEFFLTKRNVAICVVKYTTSKRKNIIAFIWPELETKTKNLLRNFAQRRCYMDWLQVAHEVYDTNFAKIETLLLPLIESNYLGQKSES